MVPTRPRYGGDIKMDYDNTHLTDRMSEQELVKMDDDQIKIFGNQDLHFHSKKGEASSETGVGKNTIPPYKEERGLVTKNDDASQQGVVSGLSPGPWQRNLGKSSRISHNQTINCETAAHSPLTKDHECSQEVTVANNDALTADDLQREDSTKVSTLLAVLKTLGINCEPKLYTKLNDEQKQYWASHFQNGEGDTLLSSIHDALSQEMLSNLKCTADSREVVYCKNLFLKDRKGQFYIVVTEESCTVDLKQLKQQLNASRNLSFANEDSMARILKAKPGEVTPFAIMHESARDVRVVFHESLSTVRDYDIPMAFHPFSPGLEIEISFSELDSYLTHYGKQLEILSLNTTQKTNSKQECESSRKHVNQKRTRADDDDDDDVAGKSNTTPDHSLLVQSDNTFGLEDNVSASCLNLNGSPGKSETEVAQKISSSVFLKTEEIVKHSSIRDARKDEALTQFELYTESVIAKRADKNRFDKNFDRKGKLKSYIKNNTRSDGENVQFENPLSQVMGVDGDHDDSGVIPMESLTQRSGSNKVTSISRSLDSKPEAVTLNDLSPKKTLPEIDQFYQNLTRYNIDYQLSATSTEIGPAVGVKCFLLKDRRQNYFLVITHEFYELDYGRLKRALHPKKKLQECDLSELIDILGVDREHFTPFAVTNERAKRNTIDVFLTQKIVPSNMILCIQHPFAQGSRILMTSSELQRFLAEFSSSNFIGSVEEKVWLKKHNWAFSQFDDVSSNARVEDGTKMDSLGPAQSDHKQTLLRSGDNKRENTDINGDGTTEKHAGEDNSLAMGDSRAQPSEMSSSVLERSFLCMKRVLNFPSSLIRRMYFSVLKSSENVDKDCDDEGSPVDEERYLKENFRNEGSDNANLLNLENDSYRVQDYSPTDEGSRLCLFHETEGHGRSGSHQHTEDGCGPSKSGVLGPVRCYGERAKGGNSIRSNIQSYGSSHPNSVCSDEIITGGVGVQIEAIRNHLDENDVEYSIRENVPTASGGRGNDSNDDDDNDDNTDDHNDDDDDRQRQVCTTRHLEDELGFSSYIVVGRDSEHINVKRFRRRFQISKRLYDVTEEGSDSCYDYSDKCSTGGPNPFAIFLSKRQEQSSSGSGNSRGVKYKMVLYTSIYMDPDMECVFVLDGKGARLCMSSQQLEDYAKRIGMEVWYMP